MNILIVGYGIVGKNIKKVFPIADIYDPNIKKYSELQNVVYDIAIVCVPTPKLDTGACDISIVESVIAKHNPKVFHIRSTIPPGTTKMLQEKYKKLCVFSPEYYGNTIHANVLEHNFLTLGCVNNKSINAKLIVEAYKEVFPADFEFVFGDSDSAEFAKYMENCTLAAIVSIMNEYHNIANKYGIDSNVTRELFLKDKRFTRYHTYVYDKNPGWKSICFDKDIPAMICFAKQLGVDVPILEAIMKYKRE